MEVDMKKTIMTSLLLFLILGSFTRAQNIRDIVKAMTLEEKASLVVGTNRILTLPPSPAPGMVNRPRFDSVAAKNGDINTAYVTLFSNGRVKGAGGETYLLQRLHVPNLVVADGPAGLRIDPKRENDTHEYYCTAFPTGSALAATWNTGLVKNTASAIGNEVSEYGVDILLGPAINILRNPLCGRNFEYYGEDPLLAGKMAAAYIQGVQSNGVGTSLKHFAVNNQETFRNGINVVVSQRAMREIYLKNFEIAVKEGKPWTIMSSYNKINGILASENHWLLTNLLRNEWGFKGFVMTDWWAEENGARQIAAGNDLLMPGTQHQYDEILNGVKDGTLSMQDLDKCVENILRITLQSPNANGRKYSNRPDLQAHALVAKNAALESMVLLKNQDVLPLYNTNIALFGNQSYDTFVGGSGSGNVNRKYKVSIEDGLMHKEFKLNETVCDAYHKYIDAEKAKMPKEDFWTIPVIQEKSLDANAVQKAALQSDAAIFTIGRMAGEGDDRTLTKGDYYLSDIELQNLKLVSKAFHSQNKKVVVLVNAGSVVHITDWIDLADGVLYTWLSGQEMGNAVADLLDGTVTPSGKLPFTIAKAYTDYPSANNFPVSTADSTQVIYLEDILVGYRHFCTNRIKPLYPFGYGLSYTSFKYHDMRVKHSDDGYDILVKISNVGNKIGKEVVQLYVSAPQKSMIKPLRELKAFAKTRDLRPGETEVVTLHVNAHDLASYNEAAKSWQSDSGSYRMEVASSAEDIRLSKTIQIAK